MLIRFFQETFPFSRDASGSSIWATEKVHSLVHCASAFRYYGRLRFMSTQATEAMNRWFRTWAKITNQQHNYQYSVLRRAVLQSTLFGLAVQLLRKGNEHFIHYYISL